MPTRQIDEQQTRWVVADFTSERQARDAAESLRGHGLAAHVVTPSPSTKIAGDEGIAVVRIGAWAWIGLLAGVFGGLVLGLLLWDGQIVVALLAPAMSAGRTAVPALLMGILGATGWLFGALLPMGVERVTRQVLVRLPSVQEEMGIVERRLVDLGAWNVRVASTAPEQGETNGNR